MRAEDYLERIQCAASLGIRVKINTVVNRVNVVEDFTAFVKAAHPLRWKLFQATRITGENEAGFERWHVTTPEFQSFVSRHAGLSIEGVVLVPETQTDIYGSYAMVGPNGCFFDNSSGTYRYSRRIVEVGIQSAWEDVEFSMERFRHRNGDYDYRTGLNQNEVRQ